MCWILAKKLLTENYINLEIVKRKLMEVPDESKFNSNSNTELINFIFVEIVDIEHYNGTIMISFKLYVKQKKNITVCI